MSMDQPFKANGPAASMALTTGSQAVQIFGDGEVVMIVNTTGVAVQVDFAAASFAATALSPHVIPAGQRALVTVGRASLGYAPGVTPSQLWVAAIPVSTTTGNAWFSRGDGSLY